MKKLLILISLCMPLLASAAQPGTALKADSLRAEPYTDARTIGTLNKGDSVDILAKKGAWLKIKSKKATGWVRLLSVKRGSTASGNTAKGVLDVASGRSGTGKVVSTTGIRGLSAEELKAAKFDETEIKKMESYTLTPNDGEQFAKAGGLSKTKLGYFKGVQ